MGNEKQTVQLFLVAPDGDHPLGTFTVDDGRVTGTDHRGIAYTGTMVRHGENAQIELIAQIPKGTPIGAQLHTEEATHVPVTIHLDAQQQAGHRTVPVRLPGFGVGDVKFVVS